MANDFFDVLVLGSGPAGVHAAWPLVTAGLRVGLIDAGISGAETFEKSTDQNFDDTRRLSPDQYKSFLGTDFSGIPVQGMNGGQNGGMLSANRSYVTDKTADLIPIDSSEVNIVQSLAKGGLAESWGAVCDFLNPAEAEAVGLPYEELQKKYQELVAEIGISGPEQTEYFIQPPTTPDTPAKKILEVYQKNKTGFEKLNLRIQQPWLAYLTKNLGKRGATQYQDMDFWADPNRSVYRPRYTLEEMIKNGLKYFGGQLVRRVVENSDGTVVVHTQPLDKNTSSPTTWQAKKIIVACGAINTARILLRSRELYNIPNPLFTKAHWYIPCLHPRLLGVAGDNRRHSLCQLIIKDISAAPGEIFCQLYSYKSLLLFRLLDFSPLGAFDSLRLLADWSPAIIIADVRLSKWGSPSAEMILQKTGSADRLKINPTKKFTPADDRPQISQITHALKKLGLIPIRKLPQPEGSSSHYVGTIPLIGTNPAAPLHADKNGRLENSQSIYIGDASTWRAIPAKPLSLTMMAHARIIGSHIAGLF